MKIAVSITGIFEYDIPETDQNALKTAHNKALLDISNIYAKNHLGELPLNASKITLIAHDI